MKSTQIDRDRGCGRHHATSLLLLILACSSRRSRGQLDRVPAELAPLAAGHNDGTITSSHKLKSQCLSAQISSSHLAAGHTCSDPTRSTQTVYDPPNSAQISSGQFRTIRFSSDRPRTALITCGEPGAAKVSHNQFKSAHVK